MSFWSLTLYNKHHLFEVNAIGRYSLGTKNKNLRHNPDGSLTLYASATPPGGDHDTNWLPAPAGTFSLHIRCYWAQAPIAPGHPHGRPTRSTRPITEESSSPQRNQARSIIAFLGWRATRPGTARM